MTTDREFMLHGPYTGVLLHEPAPYPSTTRRRAKFWRIFAILCAVAVAVGVLVALSH